MRLQDLRKQGGRVQPLPCFLASREIATTPPVTGVLNGVRNGGAPLLAAVRRNGQAAVTGEIKEPIGGVPLTLTAHTCDPVGWNAIENDHRQVCRLEEFEPVGKAVNVGREIGDLELAQTCEPANIPSVSSLGRLS